MLRCFVPNWAGHSKNNPDYRYLAIREPLRNPPLPGMEAQLELSCTPQCRCRTGDGTRSQEW